MNADGQLCDTRISNAVKCLPPQNRPKTDEIKRCVHRWLVHELDHPSVILALGKIAHEAVLRAHGLPLQGHHFAHGAVHNIGDTTLVDSFHPSPLNTQTGRLSVEDFNRVLLNARSLTEIKH